jgi:hypothetical protein
MASSGIRLGAWSYLKWGHVNSIEKDGKIVAAKLRVYVGEEEEYFTFISLEAWNELSAWMKYRESCGEIRNTASGFAYNGGLIIGSWSPLIAIYLLSTVTSIPSLSSLPNLAPILLALNIIIGASIILVGSRLNPDTRNVDLAQA